jgi:hypothetical protein
MFFRCHLINADRGPRILKSPGTTTGFVITKRRAWVSALQAAPRLQFTEKKRSLGIEEREADSLDIGIFATGCGK